MTSFAFPIGVAKAARKRADGRCEQCGDPLQPNQIHFRPVVPWTYTADTSLENCLCVCRDCFGSRRAKVVTFPGRTS